jgi:hypothetical protein
VQVAHPIANVGVGDGALDHVGVMLEREADTPADNGETGQNSPAARAIQMPLYIRLKRV